MKRNKRLQSLISGGQTPDPNRNLALLPPIESNYEELTFSQENFGQKLSTKGREIKMVDKK